MQYRLATLEFFDLKIYEARFDDGVMHQGKDVVPLP
jgi:hypothetical protein